MKTLILDDEPYCVELLVHLLRKNAPSVEVVAQYTEPQAALEFLKTNPDTDLIFLDVEMPRLNAFDLLNLLHPFSFRVIFTTAYDKYAVKAIKYSALDYLLKPIDIEELKAAVQKAMTQPAIHPEQLELLTLHRNETDPSRNRIALSTQTGVDFVGLKEIIFCSSEGSYSEVFLENGRKLVLSKNLKEMEELLPPSEFFRIHHSYLLNLQHVQRYLKGSGGEVIVTNGRQLPVARNKKMEFLHKLGIM